MTLSIKIECLPEPGLLFGHGETGFEPRRTMAKAGAVDSGDVKDIRLALVGATDDVALARRWFSRLNGIANAREKNARRYRDWPGAKKALGVNFVIEDRFVRPLDDERLKLALNRTSPSGRFEELLDIFDAKIQTFFGDVRPSPFCPVECVAGDGANRYAQRLREPLAAGAADSAP